MQLAYFFFIDDEFSSVAAPGVSPSGGNMDVETAGEQRGAESVFLIFCVITMSSDP